MYNIPKEKHALYYKLFNRRRDKYMKGAAKEFGGALKRQSDEIIAAYERGQTIDHILDTYKQPIKSSLKKVYNKVGLEFYRDTRESAKHQSGYIVEKELQEDWFTWVSQWIQQGAGEKIVNITSTTLELVKRVVDQGIQDGLSIPNTVKLLRERMSEYNKARATMIARTEVIGASNIGNYEGALSANLPMTKTWLAVGDSRTRDMHASVNGTTVSKNDTFRVGFDTMKHPHDQNAGAENVINCRCVLTWEVL